jgi:hypothetical protein
MFTKIKKKIVNTINSKIYGRVYNKVYNQIDSDFYMLPKSQITYSNDLLYTFHNSDFIKSEKFSKIYDEVKQIGGQLLKNYDIQWRIHVITYFANVVKNLEGDFVDCGVNTGFCPMAVIKYTDFEKLGKKYYFFDTFQGMDPRFSSSYEMERHNKLGYGSQVNVFENVQKRFAEYNVEIIKGAIPETLNSFKGNKVAYLSIDMNCVIPEVEALNFFWDKMVKGGVIILDDYGYPGCSNQKQAHDEFAKSKGVEVLSLPTCQGIIIKP